jgi:hypothetical protein
MEPRGNPTIEAVAAHDPVAALAMALHIPRVPYSWTLNAQFADTTNFTETIEADQQQPLSQRTWIENIEYNILLPGTAGGTNFFAGQILQPLAVASLRYSTGVVVRVWAYDAPKFVIAQDWTPIENLLSNIKQNWMAGWRIERQGALKVDMQLTQGPASTNTNVGPMTVNVTFNGFQFFDPFIDLCPPEAAAEALREAGYCLPDVHGCCGAVAKRLGIQAPPAQRQYPQGRR